MGGSNQEGPVSAITGQDDGCDDNDDDNDDDDDDYGENDDDDHKIKPVTMPCVQLE